MIRGLADALVRLYYPRLAVAGRERVPRQCPLVLVVNHPNGLLDPMVLRQALGVAPRFLAKSTLFGNVVGRLTMHAFGALPVYRVRDAETLSLDPARNDATFDLCREALARGEVLCLFPEGTSHSDPRMRPMKTGAARIVLSAEAEHQGQLGVVVLPVGLAYESKAVFRSQVLISVGHPIIVAEYYTRYLVDERSVVQDLTQVIQRGLASVLVQADTKELVDGIVRVSGLTDARLRHDLVAQHDLARSMLAAYQSLAERDPRRAEELRQSVRGYLRVLQALDIDDPWALEMSPPRLFAVVRNATKLALLLPVAGLGAVCSWIPYRFAGRVAGWLCPEEDLLGTYKILLGTLFVVSAWIVETAMAGMFMGQLAALTVLILAPLSSYASLRFSEHWALWRASGHSRWLRWRRAELTASLVERRRVLAQTVRAELEQSALETTQE